MSLDPNTSGLRVGRKLVALARQPADRPGDGQRIWHHLFGRGIVASVDNLGVLGDKPSHPGSQQYLADRFVRGGWSTKRLIRSMVLSRTYRMGSRPVESAEAIDPDDILLHRMRVRRLQGEAIRDALLAISGRLDRTQGGPSVPIHLTGFMQNAAAPTWQGRPTATAAAASTSKSDATSCRRSCSPSIRRSPSAMGKRNVSNVPAQALILLNDPFVRDQAAIWARRVLAGAENSTERRVASMYLSAFGRRPADAETARAAAFVADQGRRIGLGRPRPCADQLQGIRVPALNRRTGSAMFGCGRFAPRPISRRQMLARAANGFGGLALLAMLAERGNASDARDPLAPKPTHFPAKARSVIFLYMDGGHRRSIRSTPSRGSTPRTASRSG
ncbi:MAG: DUF1553 domain-containing protein [Isosphaeraceae bacterium]